MASQKRIVWVVSDGTGRTALNVLKAASYQFGDAGADIEVRTAGDITTEEKTVRLFKQIRRESGSSMVVYTMVSDPLRRLIHRLCVEHHILAVDLFGPLITTMQKYLERVPLERPGLTYQFNRDYFRMVDAVDFTIKHDDGRGVDTMEKSDIILIGPSRVGKTPLALYLGYMGWKVSNMPVIRERELPLKLETMTYKVFSLIIDASLLQRSRTERIHNMGDPHIEGYTDLSAINEELRYCVKLAENGSRWPVVDVSYRPIEDIAREIIQLLAR
jgi:regulator of PEP synthase PpsR (kinase-PPPase family)